MQANPSKPQPKEGITVEDHACTCHHGIAPDQWEVIDGIIERHRGDKNSVIPVLHEIQEAVGYLPLEVQKRVAEGLEVPIADVYSIVTFYALFSLKPKGRHRISVCLGTACYVKGAEQVLAKIQEELGIGAGDTTDDGEFSLEVVRCMGACGLGPVITVNDEIFARLKPDKIPEIIRRYMPEAQKAAEA